MKAVYIIHAKTKEAENILKEEGAFPLFGTNVYLSNFNPSEPYNLALKKDICLDVDVITIFRKNAPHAVDVSPKEKEKISKILGELHYFALHLPKTDKDNQ